MERRVSLKDVANVAGVHPTTVSMALRNHPPDPGSDAQQAEETG